MCSHLMRAFPLGFFLVADTFDSFTFERVSSVHSDLVDLHRCCFITCRWIDV